MWLLPVLEALWGNSRLWSGDFTPTMAASFLTTAWPAPEGGSLRSRLQAHCLMRICYSPTATVRIAAALRKHGSASLHAYPFRATLAAMRVRAKHALRQGELKSRIEAFALSVFLSYNRLDARIDGYGS